MGCGEGGGQGGEEKACESEQEGGEEKEDVRAEGSAGSDESGAGDGSDAPTDVEQGEDLSAAVRVGGSGDDVAGGESGAEAEAGGEEGEVRGVKAGPGERDASGGGERSSEKNAEAQVACGEPRSGELAEEEGGEEGSGLSVLKLPPRDERGQKRAEHDGDDSGGGEVDEEGSERTQGRGGLLRGSGHPVIEGIRIWYQGLARRSRVLAAAVDSRTTSSGANQTVSG